MAPRYPHPLIAREGWLFVGIAVVAALLLGIADSGFKYLLPEFGAFFIYTLTMAILLWRPRGLFGRA